MCVCICIFSLEIFGDFSGVTDFCGSCGIIWSRHHNWIRLTSCTLLVLTTVFSIFALFHLYFVFRIDHYCIFYFYFCGFLLICSSYLLLLKLDSLFLDLVVLASLLDLQLDCPCFWRYWLFNFCLSSYLYMFILYVFVFVDSYSFVQDSSCFKTWTHCFWTKLFWPVYACIESFTDLISGVWLL